MLEDLRHCPTLTGTARDRARQADRDALRIADDVRQLDPNQVWGAINRLGKEDPERLLATVISLAAMVDPAAYTDGAPPTWTEHIGDTAALHPDYTARPAPPGCGPADTDTRILRYADSGLPDNEIARRVGVP